VGNGAGEAIPMMMMMRHDVFPSPPLTHFQVKRLVEKGMYIDSEVRGSW
jgi:hypothetical protein